MRLFRCYEFSLKLSPNFREPLLSLADVLLAKGRYREAGQVYKRIIRSTVYGLGLSIAKQWKLDDEFYSTILELIEH